MSMEAIMYEGDKDPIETQEWLDALDSVFKNAGHGRVAFLLALRLLTMLKL